MTNEEAIKWVDDRMCFGRGTWTENHRPEIDECWQAGAMAIKALKQTAWIPVGERLPENGFDDIVLVSIGYDMEFGRCNSNGEWLIWSFTGWIYCDKVLAWMPLPEPYKEGVVK